MIVDRSILARRILVIDDEPTVRETLFRLLRTDGHTVTTASSGMEALSIFEPGKFDLVFTDLMMPTIPGDKVALEIKKRAPTQPVVAITGYIEKLRQTPVPWFDDHLGKPFSIAQIRGMVEKHALVPKDLAAPPVDPTPAYTQPHVP